jgi:hypothetical protein
MNLCVEVLRRRLVEDVLMIDDVGHPASRRAGIFSRLAFPYLVQSVNSFEDKSLR